MERFRNTSSENRLKYTYNLRSNHDIDHVSACCKVRVGSGFTLTTGSDDSLTKNNKPLEKKYNFSVTYKNLLLKFILLVEVPE